MISVCFVTTNMNIFTREQSHHLIQHIMHKLYSEIIRDINYFTKHPHSAFHLYLFFSGSQLRIGSNCCRAMRQNLYFRNNRYIQFLGISHDLLDILLSIVTSLRNIIKLIIFPFPTQTGAFTFRTDFNQFRIFLYFNTPALIIRQMPMKGVHLQACHFIKKRLHSFFPFEITSFVKHHRTP